MGQVVEMPVKRIEDITKWDLFNSIANRVELTITFPTSGIRREVMSGIINRIEAEDDGSGKCFNISFHNRPDHIFVRTMD